LGRTRHLGFGACRSPNEPRKRVPASHGLAGNMRPSNWAMNASWRGAAIGHVYAALRIPKAGQVRSKTIANRQRLLRPIAGVDRRTRARQGHAGDKGGDGARLSRLPYIPLANAIAASAFEKMPSFLRSPRRAGRPRSSAAGRVALAGPISPNGSAIPPNRSGAGGIRGTMER
jgi:hypothetical protein